MLPTVLSDLPPVTTAPKVLRSYQLQAVAAVEQDWGNEIRRVGVVAATGLGKSVIIAKLISDCYHLGMRIVCLAHRGELLDQMRRETLAVDPSIPVEHTGLVRAENDDHHAPIVYATLQTLANAKRRHTLGQREVILIDECHHLSAEGYHATFEELDGYGEECFVAGFTATMYRGDGSKREKHGLGDVIQKIAFERDLRWAIDKGFLVAPRGLTVRIAALDELNKIRNVAGDFHQGELAEVMEAAVGYTVDAIEMHALDRKSIVFAASVEACRQIADQLNERGKLRAAAVVGELGYEDRKPVYESFRTGDIDVMVTVAVLSEGADFPSCDCVVMARPTRSRVAYSQQIGRALRLYEDPWTGKKKTDALVLDLSGATRQMRLIHLSELVKGVAVKEVDDSGVELEIPEEEIEEGALSPLPRIKRQGPVDMTPIDLLGDTETLWLQTPAGVHFMDVGNNWVVFVWPWADNLNSDKFTIGAVNTRSHRAQLPDGTLGGFVDCNNQGVSLYYPMSVALKRAEEWAIDNGFTLPAKYAPWRTNNTAASDKQTALARHLGIPDYEGFTRGRCSDEISIAFASRVLDKAMRKN